MTTFKNTEFSSDKYDTDCVLEVYETYKLPNQAITSNLDCSAEDLDDICTSISQKSANPLYTENSTIINKITLPTASLVEDARFWRGQVNRSNEMTTEVVEDAQEEIQDHQIVTLVSSTSSSIDSFTPYKTIKDRIPDVITKWSVSLLHGNLLIVGHDKDGQKAMARVCNRRISSYIFHDSNDIVCSLLGPSIPDSNVPKYILDKFKMGIPEDWRIVIQYWRHYKSINCPVKYNWPALPHSSSFDQTTNWYEIPDTDASFAESGRMSLTAQQLTKKISKMQKLLRATLLKESFSCSKVLNITSRENTTKNENLSNRQIANVDSILLKSVANNNNLSKVNRVVGSNLNSCASKVQNMSPKKISLFPEKNSFEKFSFHKKNPAKRVENSSESEESETGLDTSLNKTNDDSSLSSESSFHLEPLVSENSRTKLQPTNENQTQKVKGPDIFSSPENKKITNKKIDTFKTIEKILGTSAGSSSFVSLNSSELRKVVSSTKDAIIGKNSVENKVLVLNSADKLKNSFSNSEISVSSRGRTRISTLPFWQGSRLLAEKDSIKIISSSQNSNESEIFSSLPSVNTTTKVCTESDIVQNKNDAEVFLKPPNIDTIKKCGSSTKIWKESDFEKSQTETIQLESSPKKSTNIVRNKNNIRMALNSSDIEAIKKQNRKKASRITISQSESSPEKSNKIIVSNSVNPEELLKSPEAETIKTRDIKKGSNKSNTKRSQSELSPEKSNKVIVSNSVNPEELLKSPEAETIKTRYIKKGSNKSNTKRSQSELSPKKCKKIIVSNSVNPEELLKSPEAETIKTRDIKKGSNKSNTKRSQSELSPKKCKKIIVSNSVNSEELLKSPEAETIKTRYIKKGSNKSNTKRSQSELSPKKCKKIIVSNSVNSEELLKSPETETIKIRSKKKRLDKSESERNQSQSSPERSTKIGISKISNPENETTKKRDRNKFDSEKTQSEPSPEKSTKLVSNVDFLKPPDIETIIKKRRRKKDDSKSKSYRSDSNVSNDVSSTQMSEQFLKDVSKQSQNSIRELSQLSDNSNSSICSSVSSRGRRRVNTLPFWEGHRLTVYKEEIMIQTSTTISCNIDSYVNENSNSMISVSSESSKKIKSSQDRKDSPVQSYQEVFDKTVFKKPGQNSKTVEKSVTQMQLMSTFNNDTINKTNNASTSKSISPLVKLINIGVKNNIKERKNIVNNPKSSPGIVEITEINTRLKNSDKVASAPALTKSSTKQLKELRNISKETNENLSSNSSPFRPRTRSVSKKLNYEEASQNKQLKNPTKNYIEDDLSPKYSLLTKRTRSLSNKQNDEELPIHKQSSDTKQIKGSRKTNIVEDEVDLLTKESLFTRRSRSSKMQNDEESSNYKQSSPKKQTKSVRKNSIVEDKLDLPPKESPFTRRSRSSSKMQNDEDSMNYIQSSQTKQSKSSRINNIVEDEIDLPSKESLFTRKSRSSSKKHNNEEESSNYKESSQTKQTKSSRKNNIVEDEIDLLPKESLFTGRSKSSSKKHNNEEESSNYKESSQTKQTKSSRKNNIVEDEIDLLPKESLFTGRSKSSSKKHNNEEESLNYKESSQTKQRKGSRKNTVEDDFPTIESSFVKRSRSVSINQNDDYQQKQLKNPRKNNTTEDKDDLQPFIKSKKNDEKESSNYNQSSNIKQRKNHRKNHIIEDSDDLAPKESPFKMKTRSAKKLFEDEPEINKQLKNNSTKLYKTSKAQENNKDQLQQLKVLKTNSNIKESQNSRQNLKRDHSSQNEMSPKRKSDRYCPEINYQEMKLSKSKKTISTPKSIRVLSHYNTRSPKSRSKRFKAENSFNFTIENISHIEENIPNKRTTKNNKKIVGLSPKQTTQFKAPKKRKNKQFVLPPDPNDLYILVNKNKKSKKKETKPVRETSPTEPIRNTDNSEPKKRKLFLNKNWLQSAEYFDHLSQNNEEEECSNSNFVLSLEPVARAPEFDVFSEVSGLF